MSQVLEQVIQDPVTHWGPGLGVVGPGPVGGPGIRTGGCGEVVVVLLVVVVVFVVVETVEGICMGMDFGLGISGAEGCCGVVRRGM